MTAKARFTRGSTMRHVVVMTLSSALGMTFLFLVEIVTLFWVSRLGDERLMAALGFSWTVIFFVISVGIGLAIAATALVSRALGRGEVDEARRLASGALMMTFLLIGMASLSVLVFRDAILALAGADGDTLALAGRFLAITIPSMPFLALGMTGGAVLRALGDAWRSMSVTLGAGVVVMVLDPLLIFGLGMGFDGAAIASLLARVFMGLLAIFYLVRIHDMLAPVPLRVLRDLAPPYFAIAVPATATQLSTPFGNYLLTGLVAQHGDGAVAGWAVVTRLSVLAFGGIFALSGAIGGIIGQNYGAGLLDRVRCTFRDALLFCAAYTGLAWAVLFALRDPIVKMFGLGPDGGAVVHAFVGIAAGGFVFTGGLFCANAAFNTLGRPLRSTAFNWARDGVVLFPMAWALSNGFGAPGVVYGQAAAGVVVGAVAIWSAWRFVTSLEEPGSLEKPVSEPISRAVL